MGRRKIRLRPVRRDQIDLRRLAAVVAAMAADAERQKKASSEAPSGPGKRRAA
jgi:hypothetical protein